MKPLTAVLPAAINFVERAHLPDALTRAGVDFLCGLRRKSLEGAPSNEAEFAAAMAAFPIAQATDAANRQHYELPPSFFAATLGPRRKYSCCLYPTGRETLAQAEELALAETCAHAGLADGQTILELGCGWGSLSLWMAEHYAASRIVAVSNSAPQRKFIEGEAKARGLANLTVVTADMNTFDPRGTCDRPFDRIVSVEMFEHMANWRALLERASGWLAPDGRLFLHVFAHRTHCYRFDANDPGDWIGQHFFTGGIMPSKGLAAQFGDVFEPEAEWWWDGTHYARTARDWLATFDANRATIDPILREVYGDDALRWRRRWRLFYLAVEGMFGHRGGSEWGVGHYRLKPVG